MKHEYSPDLFPPDPDAPEPADVQAPPIDPADEEEIDPSGLDGDARDDLDGDAPSTLPIDPALIPESPGHQEDLPLATTGALRSTPPPPSSASAP